MSYINVILNDPFSGTEKTLRKGKSLKAVIPSKLYTDKVLFVVSLAIRLRSVDLSFVARRYPIYCRLFLSLLLLIRSLRGGLLSFLF
jgi:hypothetical protein